MLDRCSLRRAFAIAAILFCSRVLNAAEFQFVDSFARGVKRTAQSDKLLVVIQTTAACTERPFSSPALKTFYQLTLGDTAVVEASQSRCVFVCEPIGRPFTARDRGLLPTPDQLATYFCAPDGKVLHLLIGAPSPEGLISSLDWCERIHRESSLRPETRTETIAARHGLRIADPTSVQKLPKPLKRSTAEKEKLAAADLKLVVEAAWRVHLEQLSARFGQNFSAEERSAFLAEVSKHAEPRTDFPHLIFTRHPLPSLDQLESLIAETCLNTEFWKISPRRDSVAKWVDQKHREHLTILLVITPNEEAKALNDRPPGETSWHPQSDRLKAIAGEIAIGEITASELATVLIDHGLRSGEFPQEGIPRFVVINPDGDVTAMLDKKAGESELAKVLLRYLPQSPLADIHSTSRANLEAKP